MDVEEETIPATIRIIEGRTYTFEVRLTEYNWKPYGKNFTVCKILDVPDYTKEEEIKIKLEPNSDNDKPPSPSNSQRNVAKAGVKKEHKNGNDEHKLPKNDEPKDGKVKLEFKPIKAVAKNAMERPSKSIGKVAHTTAKEIKAGNKVKGKRTEEPKSRAMKKIVDVTEEEKQDSESKLKRVPNNNHDEKKLPEHEEVKNKKQKSKGNKVDESKSKSLKMIDELSEEEKNDKSKNGSCENKLEKTNKMSSTKTETLSCRNGVKRRKYKERNDTNIEDRVSAILMPPKREETITRPKRQVGCSKKFFDFDSSFCNKIKMENIEGDSKVEQEKEKCAEKCVTPINLNGDEISPRTPHVKKESAKKRTRRQIVIESTDSEASENENTDNEEIEKPILSCL